MATQISTSNPYLPIQYAQLSFMNNGKEFVTEDISKVMARICLPILQWRMTVQDWRHVTNTIKHKRCTKTMALIDGDENADRHMEQGGHSVATNTRIYGLTHMSMLGFPEDVMYSFLLVSTEWQRLFKLVPGGISLPYPKATMNHFTHLHDSGALSSKLFPKPNLNSVPTLAGQMAEMKITMEQMHQKQVETAKQNTDIQNLLTQVISSCESFGIKQIKFH